ncbi:hypothetical protein HMI54_009171 [Coelomomyces lativittatus]|nr:hypothetical protein HMI56_004380 [Coelomomyces lativittatus]KAJ1502297.1 hypothetical protein HMI54_009171 [Coelomomyces lativittatus]
MKLAGFILLLFVFQTVCLDAQWNVRSTSEQNKINRYAARSSTDDWNRFQLRKYGYNKGKPMLDESLTKPQASERKKPIKKKEKAKSGKKKNLSKDERKTKSGKKDAGLSPKKKKIKGERKKKSGEKKTGLPRKIKTTKVEINKKSSKKDSYELEKKRKEVKEVRNTQSNLYNAQSSGATNQVRTKGKSRLGEEPEQSKKGQIKTNLPKHPTQTQLLDPETPIQSYQLPVLDLNSQTSRKTIADHNQRVLDMTTKVLNWKNDFKLFSPIGLYSALGMLSLMANKGSPSRNEINTLLGSNDKFLTAELMYVWSEYWIKKNDLVFANVFMRPKTFSSLEGTTLEEILKKSNTTLLGSKPALNKFVDKVTHGQIKEIPIEQEGNTQVFVNIMMLRFSWHKKPRISPRQVFNYYDENGNPLMKNIQYMKHIFDAKLSEGNGYKACILPLVTMMKGSTAPLAAYIFSFDDPKKEVQLGTAWTAVYKDLNKQAERPLILHIPNADLEQKIEFTKGMFPNLLRDDNKDFNPIVASNDVTVFLSQINRFCMDKDGVSAVSATHSNIGVKRFPTTLTFDTPFYIVLANPDTGVAVFSVKVAEGLDSSSHSCI